MLQKNASYKGSPFFLKRSKYGHWPEGGGGGVQRCLNVFGALFYGALYLGKRPKGGGGEGLAKRFGSLLKVLYC